MAWRELSIGVPHEYVEPISYLFSRYGHSLTMQADGPDRIMLRTFLPVASKQRLARIEIGVRLVSILEPLGDLVIRDIAEDEDWQEAWKSHFDLLRVGRRLVIKPRWIEHQPEPEEIVIEIDPGMAFGTGYHPTTHTCLEALEHILQPGMSVLDVGTGSGILAITAVKLGAAHVVALDIDPEAVRAARQNCRRTRTTRQVALSLGTVPHPLAGPGQFDLAVANISARAVCDRGPFILTALGPQGVLIASGMLKSQRHEVANALESRGCTLIQQWSQEGWASLAFRRGPHPSVAPARLIRPQVPRNAGKTHPRRGPPRRPGGDHPFLRCR